MKLKKIVAAALALCLLFAVGAAATSWEAFDDAPAPISVDIVLTKFDELILSAYVDDLPVGSTVTEAFQKALTEAGYICELDETGKIGVIAYPNRVVIYPAPRTSMSTAVMDYLVNGAFVEPDVVVKDGDSVTVSIGELIADPPWAFGRYVGLFGKYTSYPSSFWNWFKFIALFGWAWMWFV